MLDQLARQAARAASSSPTRGPRVPIDDIGTDLDAPYDLAAVGVATRAPGAPRSPGAYLHDATKPGFAIGGHASQADLGADAAAVIEHLEML